MTRGGVDTPVWNWEGGTVDEAAAKETERRAFRRAKDATAVDNTLVYGALACAVGAGIIYYA